MHGYFCYVNVDTKNFTKKETMNGGCLQILKFPLDHE